jgi:hypothetical protein
MELAQYSDVKTRGVYPYERKNEAERVEEGELGVLGTHDYLN